MGKQQKKLIKIWHIFDENLILKSTFPNLVQQKYHSQFIATIKKCYTLLFDPNFLHKIWLNLPVINSEICRYF